MFRAGKRVENVHFQRCRGSQMVEVSVTSGAGPKLPEAPVQCLDIHPCVPKTSGTTKPLSRDSDIGPNAQQPLGSNQTNKKHYFLIRSTWDEALALYNPKINWKHQCRWVLAFRGENPFTPEGLLTY